MTTQTENLPTVEAIEYPTAEQITDTFNTALILYNIAGGVFGSRASNRDINGAHFSKTQKHSKLLLNELHIALPKDGTRGVDISKTVRNITETGHERFTVKTSLRPESAPDDQPEVFIESGEFGKDLIGEYASGGVLREESVPLSLNLLSSLSNDLDVVLEAVNSPEETVGSVHQSRLARFVGRLITAS